MKRIIELSENDYMALKKDGVQNHLALADTIFAHSKPYEERPQGEWIEHLDKGYVECPFCHKQITGGDLNFCCKCGAKMKGGAE